MMLVTSLLATLLARLANITILNGTNQKAKGLSEQPNKKEGNQHRHSDLPFFIYHSLALAVRALRIICRCLR
jgi:hypothetical protein